MTGGRSWAVAGLGAAMLLLSAGAGLAQSLGLAKEPEVSWWRVVGAFVVCIALAVGAAFALRLRLRGRLAAFHPEPRRLQLVESLRLSHQIDVCLLKCDDRHLLVAATQQGAFLLSEEGRQPSPRKPK